MENNSPCTKWTTQEELNYLDNIGTYHIGVLPQIDRRSQTQEQQAATTVEMIQKKIELLQNYISAAEKRDNWGHINGKIVIQEAKSLLADYIANLTAEKHG